jgi:hypothetical protein
MKVLVSSKVLAEKLKPINFDIQDVRHVGLTMHTGFVAELFLIADKSICIEVHVIEYGEAVKQTSRRWDWVRELVSSVQDQPIVLHITEHCVNVIFQY